MVRAGNTVAITDARHDGKRFKRYRMQKLTHVRNHDDITVANSPGSCKVTQVYLTVIGKAVSALNVGLVTVSLACQSPTICG